MGCTAQQPYKRTLKLMGSRFDITVVANDSLQANKHIDTAVAEISRIEKLISSWDEILKHQKLIAMQELNL